MKRRSIIIILAAALLLAFLSGCNPLQGRVSVVKPETSPEQPKVEKSFNVKTVTVMRQDISSKLTISGDVGASASVDVYPETSGKLIALPVETGSIVTENQVIAKIDPSRPGMNYAESPVKAPISGTVTAVNADAGATVSPQMPLVTIGDISRLVITANVPERFIYLVKKGQRALISTTAAPGMKYEAKVTTISPVVNPASRTLSIELSLTGKTPIKAGMFVGIELTTSTSENTLVVPEKAILSRDDITYVFRVNGEHVEKTTVSTGIKNNGLVEISSGLSENDRVVIEGATLVSDGSKIRILNDEESR